jgi:hypothetical protein
MKELDIIFSSLSRRLGLADAWRRHLDGADSTAMMALDVAKLEVLGLLMRLQATQRPDSIVKVRRGGGDGNAN